MNCSRSIPLTVGILTMVASISLVGQAQVTEGSIDAEFSAASVLSAQQWKAVDKSVEAALEFLARTQRSDGSFNGPSQAQPAITGLATLAILSKGCRPGEGSHGKSIDRAVDFVLSTQLKSGFFSQRPVEPYLPHDLYGNNWDRSRAHAFYNHAIAALMLTELYGMTNGQQQGRVKVAIEKALKLSRKYQVKKVRQEDSGGWRYMFHNNKTESDLSVTAWQLMFMRSAKNAGFDVPEEYISDAMGYVRRCFDPARKRFRYALVSNDARYTRAMCGAGILSLSLGGEHETEMARAAAKSLLDDSFLQYNFSEGYVFDRYHYSVYYATLGMFQMGGGYWTEFYPPLVSVLLKNQNRNGSWDPERGVDSMFGNTYTTAMVVMALTIADQTLPVYQR